jgi:hypothetical protein
MFSRKSSEPTRGSRIRWNAYPRSLAIPRLLKEGGRHSTLFSKADGLRENFKLPPVCLSANLRNHRHDFIRVRAFLRIGAERSHNVVVGLTRQHAGVDVRSPGL